MPKYRKAVRSAEPSITSLTKGKDARIARRTGRPDERPGFHRPQLPNAGGTESASFEARRPHRPRLFGTGRPHGSTTGGWSESPRSISPAWASETRSSSSPATATGNIPICISFSTGWTTTAVPSPTATTATVRSDSARS